MLYRVSGLRNAFNSRRPAASRLLSLAASVVVSAAALLPFSQALAQERPVAVQLWVAGRILPLTHPAVWTGRDTYIPLAALPAIGAKGTLSTQRNGVSVRLRSGRSDVLPLVRRDGVAMISLTDLADFANASTIKPSPAPSAGLKPNTAYLLAHITDVHVASNSLHITTSFPVPFVSVDLPGASARGYVDCVGATKSQDFKAVPIPSQEHRAERIRIGQFSPDIARVVVDLAPGAVLERNSTEGKVTPTFVASLEPGSSAGPVARVHRRPATEPVIDEDQIPPTTHRRTGGRTTIPDEVGDGRASEAPSTRPRNRTRPTDSGEPTGTGATSARTTDIRSIAYEVQDNRDIQIIIETSRKARAYVRYSATARQVVVDIPNSRLNLDDDRQKDQDIQHPLVEGLTAATVQNSTRLPPLTRITIDAPRIVATAVESDSNQIVIDITLPKTGRSSAPRSKGNLNAIIVVDPGHGGALTGATARVRDDEIYEKDITLGIASKLRTALEARGTRVIMTRESDVNVPLETRPQIANEVGANVFVSIHNDSWGKANSITGTTIYYHGSSAASRRLARCVEQELADVSGLRDRGAISDTAMYPEGFCVLRETSMPAVLCEVGYINNKGDRTKLLQPAYQRRVAEAICRGIHNYASGERTSARRRSKRLPSAV